MWVAMTITVTRQHSAAVEVVGRWLKMGVLNSQGQGVNACNLRALSVSTCSTRTSKSKRRGRLPSHVHPGCASWMPSAPIPLSPTLTMPPPTPPWPLAQGDWADPPVHHRGQLQHGPHAQRRRARLRGPQRPRVAPLRQALPPKVHRARPPLGRPCLRRGCARPQRAQPLVTSAQLRAPQPGRRARVAAVVLEGASGLPGGAHPGRERGAGGVCKGPAQWDAGGRRGRRKRRWRRWWCHGGQELLLQ